MAQAQLTVDVEIGPTMRAALDVLDFYVQVRDELPSDCELLERFDDRAAALMDVVNAFMRRA